MVVVAVAADTQAIALRDARGVAVAYSRGQWLGTSAWRLKAIHRDTAILETDEKFEGETLVMHVRAGQKLPNATAVEARASDANEKH